MPLQRKSENNQQQQKPVNKTKHRKPKTKPNESDRNRGVSGAPKQKDKQVLLHK